MLFNLASTLTVVLGVATLYAALLLLTLAGAGLMLEPGMLERQLGHEVDFVDYARLAWFVELARRQSAAPSEPAWRATSPFGRRPTRIGPRAKRRSPASRPA